MFVSEETIIGFLPLLFVRNDSWLMTIELYRVRTPSPEVSSAFLTFLAWIPIVSFGLDYTRILLNVWNNNNNQTWPKSILFGTPSIIKKLPVNKLCLQSNIIEFRL